MSAPRTTPPAATPGFPLAPPPPGYATRGALPAVAAAFAAHVAAEDRDSWTSASASLELTPAGRLGSVGFAPSALEEGGLRALLVYYNDCFPRATPVLSKLSAPTMAAVWAELFDRSDRRVVRVCERRAANLAVHERQVYAVTTPGYAVEYDVARVVGDVAAMLGGAAVPCALTYDAATLDARLVLELDEYDLVLTTTDRYGDEVAGVRVWTKPTTPGGFGRDLGDPLPTLKKRRTVSNGAEAGVTVAEGIRARIGASFDYYTKQVGRR